MKFILTKFFIFVTLIIIGKIQSETRNQIFLNVPFDTGFVNITNTSDIFYWYFPSSNDQKQAPLIFWLTGGPGCSSVLAMLTENGPFHVKEDLTLEKNPYSWSNISNLVYVDQPVGTGYSKAKNKDLVKNEAQVAEDFEIFLSGFLIKHSDLKERKIYITGESFAGHYVPAIASELLKKKYNIAGIAIGNGWVNPYQQYAQYSVFAYENKLISKPVKVLLDSVQYICQRFIEAKVPWETSLTECESIADVVLGDSDSPNFNLYDIRQKCKRPPLCYDFSKEKEFLQRQDVIKSIGVEGRKWTICNDKVQFALLDDYQINLANDIAFILENKLQVLIYSGDKDFICNWRGGEAVSNQIDWPKKQQFQNTTFKQWIEDETPYGEYKKVDNLIFLRVYNAGHLVPMDQPLAAYLLLKNLINQWSVDN